MFSKSVSVTAVVSGSESTVEGPAAFDRASTFEIGSITKTFTGLVLARLVDAGTVRLEDGVGTWVDVGDAGDITLLELATHTSGLPRVTATMVDRARLVGGDPYCNVTVADVLDDVAEARRSDRGRIAYSNAGFMLLGHVLSVAAGCSYEELVDRIVFTPLAMRGASFADASMAGHRLGLRVPRWHFQLNGAGGVTATIADMALYALAMADPTGSALGDAAVMAQREWARDGDTVVGLGWQHAGSTRWHNGGTGGFGAFLIVDPSRGNGVVVLSNRAYRRALGDDGRARLDALRS